MKREGSEETHKAVREHGDSKGSDTSLIRGHRVKCLQGLRMKGFVYKIKGRAGNLGKWI